MKIDAHQHFWHYRKHEYPWIGPGMDALSRDYLPAEFERLMRSAGFGGSIAVQARQVPEETAWLLDLADAHPFIKGSSAGSISAVLSCAGSWNSSPVTQPCAGCATWCTTSRTIFSCFVKIS